MAINDAVILAAGRGTRLLPLTETVPKPLIKIAGKEIIRHILDSLQNAGIRHSVIIVNHLTEKFYDFLDEYFSTTSMEIELVSQVDKKGTAYAIYSAKDFVEENFIVASGDHVLDGTIYSDAISSYRGESLVMLKEVPDPKNYGVAVLKDGRIVDMEEKPEHPRSNLSNIGIYIFNSQVFDEIKDINLSQRGEYEITDVLIGKLGVTTKKYWIDVGYPWHILEANSWILNNYEENTTSSLIENTTIKGKLTTGKNVKIYNSFIEGNVYIGDNTIIGPFSYIKGDTSIGSNCNIGPGTTIKNSLIGDNVNAKHLTYIGDSVIGNNVNFGASTQIANLRFDEKDVVVKINGTFKNSGKRKFGAVVGDNVKTGVNSSILPGAVIPKDYLIYPGEVIHKLPNKRH